jgi:hypothetical protein
VSRERIWAPFPIGFVGGALLVLVSIPIAEYFGVVLVWLPKLTLYWGMPVLIVIGPAIGFTAAIASRTWRGLLTLLLGFAAAGTALGLIWVLGGVRRDVVEVALEAAHFVTLALGFLGVPAYVITVGALQVIDRLREPRPPKLH